MASINHVYIFIYLPFQINTGNVQCYYCAFQHSDYNSILQHQSMHHPENIIKVKEFQIHPTHGNIQQITKNYKHTSSELLKKQQKLLFDKSSNDIYKFLQHKFLK